MLDEVIERLASFGCTTITDSDTVLLNFAIGKVTSTIKNDVNWQDIPEGLLHIAIDMVIGEFLTAKKVFSPDDLGLDLECAAKQIQEGDTNVVFATGEASQTDEQRLDALISYLLTHGRDEFSSFRRIRW